MSATINNKPTIAVVIPIYNRELVWNRTLATLASVLQQDRLPQRLIVVDDGSTDKTVDNIFSWVKETKGEGISIELIRQDHKGVSSARNCGLDKVRDYKDCEYLLFLDSDDQIPSDFLARCALSLSSNPQAIAVSTPRHSIYDNYSVFDDMEGFSRAPLSWALYYGGSVISCSLFRLSAIPSRGFDPEFHLGEDIIFVAQMAARGEWLHSPGEVVNFWRLKREGSVSLTTDNLTDILQAIRAREVAARKGMVAKHTLFSILSDWYGLAANKSDGLGKYFGIHTWLALSYRIMAWITWLARI